MTQGPVVHLDDLKLTRVENGERFQKQLGRVMTGAKHLGARLTVVPAGKTAWPYHCHHANDEMFAILEGSGTLRFGGAEHAFAAGDVLVCPAGGQETAHQIINSGDGALRYLAISSMREPDIMEYPDSGKWGAEAGSAPGGESKVRTFLSFVPADAEIDYWKDES
jgi:uncharacterized cupin superfamily protein